MGRLQKADVLAGLVFCALLLCIAADVILERRFAVGMLAFLYRRLFEPRFFSLPGRSGPFCFFGWFSIAAPSSFSANIFHSWETDFFPSWFIRPFCWACFHWRCPLCCTIPAAGLFAAGALLFFCSGLLLTHNLTTKNRPTAKPSGYATGTNLLFSYSRLAYFIDKFHISGT